MAGVGEGGGYNYKSVLAKGRDPIAQRSRRGVHEQEGVRAAYRLRDKAFLTSQKTKAGS